MGWSSQLALSHICPPDPKMRWRKAGKKGGLVQIPCIERNAYAAARAFDAGIYSLYTDGRHRVTFDQVVNVMKETGKDLPSLYKETSEGGLAKEFE